MKILTTVKKATNFFNLKSRLLSNSVTEAVGKMAADQYLKSMDVNFIETPTICVSDPSNKHSWEWAVGLDSYQIIFINNYTS